MTTLDDWIAQYAQAHSLNPSLVRNVIKVESDFNPKAISPAGAIGYMQLMPKTAAGLKVDPHNPEQNIMGGTKYLSEMISKYGLQNGLAAYNWGPGNVDKFLAGKQEMPADVRKYVSDVTQANATMPPVTNIPTVTTTGDVKMEPYNDEYTKMALFNPYVQLALGIMSGNSGMSKSEAFSNAMKGGLGAVQTGQEMQRRQLEEKRQAMLDQMKMREYERMRAATGQTKAWAKSILDSNPNHPMADILSGIATSDDPEAALKLGQLMNSMQHNQMLGNYYSNLTSAEYLRDRAAASAAGKQPRPNVSKNITKAFEGAALDVMKNLPGDTWGWTNEGDYKLAQEKKKQILQDSWSIYSNSDEEITVDEAVMQALQRQKKVIQPEATTTTPTDIVTDSSGRKWRYKGSGDKTKQENYELVQ